MENTPSSTPGREISKPSPKRRSSRLIPFLLFLGILIAIGLFVWAEWQRRETAQELAQTAQQLEEARKATNQSGEEVANAVLEKVRRHVDVPTDPQPTVATIVDIERLRETSEFYNKADNGDHLIITENRAILYDPDRDIVIDVVPVRINPVSPTPTTPPGTSPTPTPTTNPAN